MDNRRKRELDQKIKKVRQENPFNLPPDISFTKSAMPDGTWSYNFRHQKLGALGRILIQSSSIPGQCHITSEIAGDPDDPMTEKRADIFKPIALDLTERMAQVIGQGTIGAPPPPPHKVKPMLFRANYYNATNVTDFMLTWCLQITRKIRVSWRMWLEKCLQKSGN